MNQLKRALNWLYVTLRYGGTNKEDYEIIQTAINRKNAHTLFWASGFCSLVLLALSISSFISEPFDYAQVAYVSFTMALVAVAALSYCSYKYAPGLSLPLWYLMLSFAYAFGIGLGLVHPDYPSSSFFAILVMGPLLFIDKPWRIVMAIFAACAVAYGTSCLFKPPYIVGIEAYNYFAWGLIGACSNVLVLRSKINEILLQSATETERDTDTLTSLLAKNATQREISAHLAVDHCVDALLIVDLDDFKHINDTYGHAFGDDVITKVGSCITQTFRGTDILGRFGGDEFVLFLPGLHDKTMVDRRIHELTGRITNQVTLPDGAPAPRISAGAAFSTPGKTSYSVLFDRADTALYKAKNAGKSRYALFDDDTYTIFELN